MIKKLFFVLFSLLNFEFCYGQDSTRMYLESVKMNFEQSDLIDQEVIKNYNIVFIGETHGFQKNYEIGYKLISEYKRKTNFEYILSETDWASSQKLNSILNHKDTLALLEFMNESKGSPAWCKERFEFFKKIMVLNETVHPKIKFVGVDIPSGSILPALHVLRQIENKNEMSTTVLDSFIVERDINKRLVKYLENLNTDSIVQNFDTKDQFAYQYQVNNILNYVKALRTPSEHRWDMVRDSCMFENFKLLEEELNLQNKKMIGVWGVTHTYQTPSEGVNWFASSLTQKMNKKVYSYRVFCFDSKGMFPSSWLPGFLKIFKSKRKLYYDLKLLNDDGIFTGKKQGIKDLKKITPQNTIYFYSLTQSNSPYQTQPFLVSSTKTDWVTTQYFQTAIVVKNSNATTPLGENRK